MVARLATGQPSPIVWLPGTCRKSGEAKGEPHRHQA